MSQGNGQPLDPVELASLPADDPRRAEYGGSLTAEARQAWEQELDLTDRLRTALPRVEIPAGLEGRLLAIPDAVPYVVREARRAPMGSRAMMGLAAGLVILAGLAALYFLVIRQPARPLRLDPALAQQMAALAVEHHKAPLEIASADSAVVEKTLAAHALDFPVLMLKPSAGTLVGGGVVDFGPAKAAFTQWKVDDQTYTLYEFNGKNLGVPAQFASMIEFPSQLWKGDLHYQVFLFPGTQGKCCWALVMEKDNANNVFSQYGSAY